MTAHKPILSEITPRAKANSSIMPHYFKERHSNSARGE